VGDFCTFSGALQYLLPETQLQVLSVLFGETRKFSMSHDHIKTPFVDREVHRGVPHWQDQESWEKQAPQA
jgi:hypothetical protein